MSSATAATTPSSAEKKTVLRIGTRSSILAKVQTRIVQDLLAAAHPGLALELVETETQGDKNQSTPLHRIGAKSLWTGDLETMLLDGGVDLIVHSLKDMPTTLPPGCTIGAILSRSDPRDAFVARLGSPYTTLSSLPAGAVVGTSSVRRMAQLRRLHPSLTIRDVRGNIHTRLRKLDTPAAGETVYDGLILAASGLERMDWGGRCSQMLEYPEMLWGVGQGALGVEVRSGDENVRELLSGVGGADGPEGRCVRECLAEREVMRRLEGGCSVPIGVDTKWVDADEGEERLRLRARVVSVDGKECVETEMVGEVRDVQAAEAFGRAVAEELKAKGAGKILDKINESRGEGKFGGST